MIIGGGAALGGLIYYAWKKNNGQSDALMASLVTGESVPVDTAGNKTENIPTEVVQQLPVSQVKELTKTNPEVLAQITPKQAVEIIDTTPGIKAFVPKVVQDAIKQMAATGTTQPVAQVIPTSTEPVAVIVQPAPAPVPSSVTPTTTYVAPIATKPVSQTVYTPPVYYQPAPEPVVYQPSYSSGGGGAGPVSRVEQMRGLGSLERLVL